VRRRAKEVMPAVTYVRRHQKQEEERALYSPPLPSPQQHALLAPLIMKDKHATTRLFSEEQKR
jgi:hypothetical protein